MPTGDIPGWHEVFADSFNGRTLDRSRWRVYWGPAGGDPAAWFSPSHVSVSKGMLVISAYHDPADGDRWVTGGVSSSPSLVQAYGKYLVRLRVEAGTGIGHALLLTPADGSWPPEIDFSEDNGRTRDRTAGDAALRRRRQEGVQVTRVDLTQWHTLGVEWTPRMLRYTIDGRVWATVTGSEVPAVPMALAVQTQAVALHRNLGRLPRLRHPGGGAPVRRLGGRLRTGGDPMMSLLGRRAVCNDPVDVEVHMRRSRRIRTLLPGRGVARPGLGLDVERHRDRGDVRARDGRPSAGIERVDELPRHPLHPECVPLGQVDCDVMLDLGVVRSVVQRGVIGLAVGSVILAEVDLRRPAVIARPQQNRVGNPDAGIEPEPDEVLAVGLDQARAGWTRRRSPTCRRLRDPDRN